MNQMMDTGENYHASDADRQIKYQLLHPTARDLRQAAALRTRSPCRSRGMTSLSQSSSQRPFKRCDAFCRVTQKEEQWDERLQVPPAILLRQLAFVMRASRALYAVAEPGIADNSIPAELTVWAVGVKGQDVLAHLDGLEVNRASQLVTRRGA
jgi:hypothetical protein